ncbi:MAG: pyrroloquinoline quinone-dependent dehydrogenase [Pseudomonadales bacterium]|nr:pyrroloquinoline quinone-dependent dehydrogenase [Pseudomonadales bacterium]
MIRIAVLTVVAVWVAIVAGCGRNTGVVDYAGPVADWPAYGSSPGGGHYSAATQITRDNVHALQQAWVYRSGDMREPGASMIEMASGVSKPMPGSSWQMTPILVGDTLYGCTTFNRMFALDPGTGVEKWSFDPGVDKSKDILANCRGVSSWQSRVPSGADCDHRIVMGTLDGRLIAVSAAQGKPCADFGSNGTVDLREGLGEHAEHEYSVTSPPAIIGERIIIGAQVLDRTHDHMPSGVVRAYNARSGALEWYWDAIPPGQTPTMDSDGKPQYRRGSTNVWSVISVDEERDLVFLPTGNTSIDFFGGKRDNLDFYSSSVVALKGSSGELVWHYQMVHHDLWDYDTPAQPTLFELERDGRRIPALAQPTKMGHLFILDRETGEPLFPVEERAVSQQGQVAGEYLSPTQPFPLQPVPLNRAPLSVDDAWGFTFWDRNACRERIAGLRNEGIFTPPSTQGSVYYPSDFGGNNWGTPAIDPLRKLIVLNTMYVPSVLTLIPRAQCAQSQDMMTSPQLGTPYCVKVEPLLSPLGAPCVAPPWGTLAAIDLVSGDKRWEIPLGTLGSLAPWPFSKLKGAPNVGGASVTAGGVTFIAATPDYFLRAFDSETGEELWKTKLPTGGHATPMVYRAAADQKQYVVIAVGGHWGMPQEPVGDYLIAFAL